MSVSRTTFVYRGIRIEGLLADRWNGAYENLIGNGHIILDGMRGEYTYVGRVIAQSDDHLGFEKGIVIDGSEAQYDEEVLGIIRQIPEVQDRTDIQTHVFTHLS